MNQLAPLTAAAIVLAWTGGGALRRPDRGRREPAAAVPGAGAPPDRLLGGGNGEPIPERDVGGRALRALALAALLVAVVVNVVTDIRLLDDFGSLTVLGASDVDGW
jgi:hypothetical protein